MSRERVLTDSKNYLISVHDALRRAFRIAPTAENVFITTVLDSLEKDVKQLEMLEEMIEVWKISKKHKNQETINEE